VLDAADAVQASWARTAPRERAEILRRAFDLVTERAEDFALLMTLEMGKPLAEARGEVTYGAEFLRWFSEETVRDYGRYLTTPEGKNKILVQHKPVGPCLLITPWNFPLAMATRKVAPAIAAGCTMVLKPAEAHPAHRPVLFAQTMLDAGLPAGVLNVVSSSSASGISGPLLKDPRLRKVSFTGSTPVGKRLMADAAQNVLRTSMELGGNAPFIVFEDADLDKAVEGAMAAKMRNMGEACTAANRFLVQESVAQEFTKFAAAMGALATGRGTEPATQVGPLIDAGARDDVHALVSAAVDAGATALTGGAPVDGPGYFYQPTVLGNVPNDARSSARKSSDPSPRSPRSPPRRTPSGWPTPANTASPPTSTAATSTGCSAWPNRSSSAWSGSTPASSPTPQHPSAASSNPASAAKAAPKASPNTPPPNTSASPTPTRSTWMPSGISSMTRPTPRPCIPGRSRPSPTLGCDSTRRSRCCSASSRYSLRMTAMLLALDRARRSACAISAKKVMNASAVHRTASALSASVSSRVGTWCCRHRIGVRCGGHTGCALRRRG
jgi:hypothetical protein